MLCPDPAARGRLTEITRNLADRISEARINGWLGEVEGLKVSLAAARAKLAALDRTVRNTAPGSADLEHGASGGTPMAPVAWNAAITALNDGELPCSGGERLIIYARAEVACRACRQSRIVVIS